MTIRHKIRIAHHALIRNNTTRRAHAAQANITAPTGTSEPSKLESFAKYLQRTPKIRHVFFAGLTLFAVLFTGYHFGTFDQAIHIPYLQKFADPTLYPNDSFLDLRSQHYSFFWFLWLPFYRLGVLEIALFIAHLGATYLTFWAFWTLGETLFHNPLVSLAGTLMLALPHMAFGGFPILEFSLLNRTFVLPLLLWCLILYLRGHPFWAYACLGLLYNLHVVSVNFAMAMVLVDGCLQILKTNWRDLYAIRSLVLKMLLFILCAAPVLLWKAGGPPVTLKANPEWFSIINSHLYHLFYLISPCPQVMLTSLNGLSMLAFFGIARLHTPASQYDGIVTHFMYAIVILLLVQVLLTFVYPATFLLQLQIVRAGLFAVIFGYIYFIQYLINRYHEKSLSPFYFYWLLSATIVTIFPVVILPLWFTSHLLPAPTHRQKIALVIVLIAIALGSYGGAIYEGIWGPGIHLYGPQNAWQEVQLWAREHTPKEAMFITPPHRWGLYETEWRVFSQRANLVAFSDVLEVGLVPDYAETWCRRFDEIAPGARTRFKEYYFDNREITAEAFYTLTTEDFARIASEYNASYLVVEKPHRYNFPIVYENQDFIAYRLDTVQP